MNQEIENKAKEFVKKWWDRFKKHPDALTIDYLHEIHPHLTPNQCKSLLEFSHKCTIYLKGCYGKGEIIYPEWVNRNETGTGK